MSTEVTNEATTAMLAQREVADSESVQNFLAALTEEQRRRFQEFAHHFLHLGFENGMSRTGATNGPTIEQQAVILVRETALYQAGFAAGAKFDGLESA